MKRVLTAFALVVAMLVAGVATQASAVTKPVKLAKPPKVDPKAMVVVGGLFPQVEPAAPFANDGSSTNAPWGYGRVAVFFPAIPTSFKVHTVTLTCTPKPSATSGTDYPTEVITDTYYVKAGTTSYTQVQSDGTTPVALPMFWQGAAADAGATAGFKGAQIWSLWSKKYPGEKAPQLSCAVTLDNTNASNPAGANPLLTGGAAVASKAPKTNTGPASNCPSIEAFDNGNFAVPQPAGSMEPPPVAPTVPGRLNLKVRIDAGVSGFTFCTTDSNANPKWLTDQELYFDYSTKVNVKLNTVTFKKVKLVAPLKSSLLLQTVGSEIILQYPASLTPLPSVPGTNKCSIAAAKVAGKVNSCTFDISTRTVKLTSTDIGTVKPGKDIVGPLAEFTFEYNGTTPPNTADLTFITSNTTIKFGGFEVKVNVDDTAGCGTFGNPPQASGSYLDTKAGNDVNACFPGQGVSDPNSGVAVLSASGLI